ncbi:MAG: creatininase family protein [Phycisphaeraceae bacterium]
MSNEPQSQSGILEEMTIEGVRAMSPRVVMLGIGSTEPHGPHLPYGTDLYQTDAVCRRAVTRANDRGARVLMYPTLPISTNANFQAFPFACRIGVRTLMNVLLDIIEALEQDGIRKVVLVNGHGGNPDVVRATVREHVGRRRPGEGAFVCMTSTTDVVPEEARAIVEHPSDHAGENETSRMLHLRPDLVRPEKFDDFLVQKPTIDHLRSGRMFFVRPWHGYIPASAGGETRSSSAEKGQTLTDAGADWLADFLVALAESPWHDQFPYPPASQ